MLKAIQERYVEIWTVGISFFFIIKYTIFQFYTKVYRSNGGGIRSILDVAIRSMR